MAKEGRSETRLEEVLVTYQSPESGPREYASMFLYNFFLCSLSRQILSLLICFRLFTYRFFIYSAMQLELWKNGIVLPRSDSKGGNLVLYHCLWLEELWYPEPHDSQSWISVLTKDWGFPVSLFKLQLWEQLLCSHTAAPAMYKRSELERCATSCHGQVAPKGAVPVKEELLTWNSCWSLAQDFLLRPDTLVLLPEVAASRSATINFIGITQWQCNVSVHMASILASIKSTCLLFLLTTFCLWGTLAQMQE